MQNLRTIVLVLLAAVGLCLVATADSAGWYQRGPAKVEVETRINDYTGALQVRLTEGGQDSGWVTVSIDPKGDGRDVGSSGNIQPPGGHTYKWESNTLKVKIGSRWWNPYRIDPDDDDDGDPVGAFRV